MAFDVEATNDLIRQQQLKMLEDTKFNLEQVTKMLTEIRKIEEDPIAPVTMKEVYGDMWIPDVRDPEQSLTKLYPHYFVRIFDQRNPEYRSHRADSPEFQKEKEQVYTLVRSIRQCQTSWIERERAKCWQQSEDRI